MSKPVRIKEHLYSTIEEMARAENRSITNMIEVLLSHAISLEAGGMGRIMDGERPVGITMPLRDSADDHFKPDPK